jgi:hypothetical protein
MDLGELAGPEVEQYVVTPDALPNGLDGSTIKGVADRHLAPEFLLKTASSTLIVEIATAYVLPTLRKDVILHGGRCYESGRGTERQSRVSRVVARVTSCARVMAANASGTGTV